MPFTATMPKCLMPIHNKPLLGYWLDLLGNAGLAPLVVNTHYHAQMVRDFVAENPWKERVILFHEKSLLGTGGTLLANRALLDGGTFMVVHADNLSRFSVEDFLDAHRHRPKECIMTMMLFRTPTPRTCGIVQMDVCGVVTEFHEKVEAPPSDLANGAVYLMEPEALGILADAQGESRDISLELIPRCLGRIYTWLNDDYHRDIGTPDSYAAALREFVPNVEKEWE